MRKVWLWIIKGKRVWKASRYLKVQDLISRFLSGVGALWLLQKSKYSFPIHLLAFPVPNVVVSLSHSPHCCIVYLFLFFVFYILLHLYSSCVCMTYLPLDVKQQSEKLFRLHKKNMFYLTQLHLGELIH
jgi:hypothetical protein